MSAESELPQIDTSPRPASSIKPSRATIDATAMLICVVTCVFMALLFSVAYLFATRWSQKVDRESLQLQKEVLELQRELQKAEKQLRSP